MKIKNKNSGFSEIEVGMFIVIIAFFVVMVRTCQDYAEDYKLKNDIVNINVYKSAIDNFKTKYGQLPGDFNKAKETFADCADISALKVTCNGNGDGLWNNSEGVYVFDHLSRAEMVDAEFNTATPGSNVNLYPLIESTGQSIVPIGGLGAEAQATLSHIFFNYTMPANSFLVYFENNVVGAPIPIQKRIEHVKAATIDKKLDDGIGGTGNIRAAYDDSSVFGAYKQYELCVDKNGRYKGEDNDNTYCSLIIKY